MVEMRGRSPCKDLADQEHRPYVSASPRTVRKVHVHTLAVYLLLQYNPGVRIGSQGQGVNHD